MNVSVTGLRLAAKHGDLCSTGNSSAAVLGVTAVAYASGPVVLSMVGLEVVMVNTTAIAMATELGDPNCVWSPGQPPARITDITQPWTVPEPCSAEPGVGDKHSRFIAVLALN